MQDKKCENCSHYYAYYVQIGDFYDKLTYGYCLEHNKEKKQCGTCENF